MADERPAFEDMPQYRDALRSHPHTCATCGRWWHDDGDAGCVEVEARQCPAHEGVTLPVQCRLVHG